MYLWGLLFHQSKTRILAGPNLPRGLKLLHEIESFWFIRLSTKRTIMTN
jgi:hypothetical protein